LANYTDVSDTDGVNDSRISVKLGRGSSSTGNLFVDERLGASPAPTTFGQTAAPNSGSPAGTPCSYACQGQTVAPTPVGQTNAPTPVGQTGAPTTTSPAGTPAPTLAGQTGAPTPVGQTNAPTPVGQTGAPTTTSPAGTPAPTLAGQTGAPTPVGQTNAPTPVGQTGAPTTTSPAGTPAPTLAGQTVAPTPVGQVECAYSSWTDWCSNYNIPSWHSPLLRLRVRPVHQLLLVRRMRLLQLDRLVFQLQHPQLARPLLRLRVRPVHLLLSDRRLFRHHWVRTGSPTSRSPSVSSAAPNSVQPLGSISGKVKEDVDNNDSGDVDLANVFITLLDSGGIVVGTTLTDSSGTYAFYNLPAGNYTICRDQSCWVR
jgi:hypothetical protein